MSPAPWRLVADLRCGAVVDAQGRMVCALRGHSRRWQQDGPVIAVAPELTAQLRAVLDWWDRAGHACIVPEPAWVAGAREVLGRMEHVDKG